MPAERDQVRTLLILGGLTALFVLGFWLPASIRESRLRDELLHTEQAVTADRQSAAGLAVLARQVVALQSSINRSQKYIPQESELADLLRQLSVDLDSHQAAGQETQTGAVLPGGEFSVLPVTLRFRGSFPGVFALLRQVESMRRLLRVTRLELTSDPRRPQDPLTVRIELFTFFSQTEAKAP